ncbi:Uncharacterized protein dnl_13870 [Desulfonema limicola]|uniref:Uncharacterized protein n=1 Tax=Desulfonema limicola TaxID=45656 RepID=A0A975B5E8_9BACT|nr:Uncharacterized protein dnl_13870 [Desulfonema limicola]
MIIVKKLNPAFSYYKLFKNNRLCLNFTKILQKDKKNYKKAVI